VTAVKAPPTPAAIAARLTPGQRSTVRYMTPTACVLGCSEATARNLLRGGPRRPPLTFVQPGQPYAKYGLNALGEQVRVSLTQLELAGAAPGSQPL
jgi:hypothetical protein